MKILVAWISILLVAFAEPSVYSKAVTYKSNLNSGSSSSGTIYRLQQQVASLKEELDGLKSLVESLSERISKGLNTPKSLPTEPINTPKCKCKDYKADIDMLRSRVEKLEDVVRDLNRRLPLSGLGVVKSQPKREVTPTKRVTHNSHKDKDRVTNVDRKGSNYSLYKKGVILFDRKRYSDAERIFKSLIDRGYKRAATNFYLGEIAYRTGRYRDAIKYYQRSAELNENAAYMDRLLLHAGISLEKDGDKEQAKRFYEAIIDGYPDTTSARIAKKRLK